MRGSKSTYTPEKAEQFLKRLRGCEGNLRQAARSLGMSESTPQDWKRNHPEFARRWEEFKKA